VRHPPVAIGVDLRDSGCQGEAGQCLLFLELGAPLWRNATPKAGPAGGSVNAARQGCARIARARSSPRAGSGRSLPRPCVEQAADGRRSAQLFPEAGAGPRSQAPETKPRGPTKPPKKPSFLQRCASARNVSRDEAIATIEPAHQQHGSFRGRGGLGRPKRTVQFSVPRRELD